MENKDYLIKKYEHYWYRHKKLKDHYEKNNKVHKCSEDSLRLTYRTHSNGKGAYVYQCNICGIQKGTPIKKEKALSLSKTILQYQDNLHDEYKNKTFRLPRLISKVWRKVIDIRNEIEGIPKEDFEILTLEEKAEKNQKIMDELYLNLNKEFKDNEGMHYFIGLFRSYIKDKIIDTRLEKNSADLFKKESEVFSWFYEYFKEDFYIEKEVKGLHIVEKQNVRIDFVIFPREHLIEKGFIEECIGVEIKYINPQSSDLVKKANKAIWQTISYNDCEFYLKRKTIKPKFCMVFSNLSFENEERICKEYAHADNRRIWFDYLLLANHANVGEIKITGDRDNPKGWRFKFGNSGAYFRRRKIKDIDSYEISNERLITKKRIGNIQ